ncbi:MAG: CpeR family transcriptional regulator [Cyanothece sp. SIO2G6]|nr:CpeR family transcriptional regulator [Cyanothece sp. SIO2G6]
MLPPAAEKRLRTWIRSRHLICSGNYFIFESVDFSAIERFGDCIEVLGGALISVDTIGKVWIGDRRQLLLYRAKGSLLIPNNPLKQYWIKYGSFHTRFDDKV